MSITFRLLQSGDSALDILFDATPSQALSETIIALQFLLEQEMHDGYWPGLRELIPAYRCLTLCYDPLQVSGTFQTRLQAFVQKSLQDADFPQRQIRTLQPRLVEIPVCYEDQFATDMELVCAHSGLTREDIIARHCAPEYLVHMLGFTPGFLYLGGLDPKLHCPRKDNPTLRVAAGSVGIGGAQTGIYPQTTPGGWQVIGRTPLCLFDPLRKNPFIARPLDRIRFVAIHSREFETIQQEERAKHRKFDLRGRSKGSGYCAS